MKTGIVVQARTGSTRLPAKMIREFYDGRSLLEVILGQLQTFSKQFNLPLILATTVSEKDDQLAELAEQMGIDVERGSENDVLQRFIDSAGSHDLDRVIRICGDNPFIQLTELSKLIDANKDSSAEYISFRVNDKPSILTHFGFWGEAVGLQALEKAAKLTDDSFYHEHVTNFIYGNPDQFECEWINPDPLTQGRNNVRLTIDTEDDFIIAQKMYAELNSNNSEITIERIFNYLDSNPEILDSMEKSIIANQK